MIFPLLMQDVQTFTRRVPPPTTARTSFKLMFQRRFVTLCAWLTLCPNWGPRPQSSHVFAIRQKSPQLSKLVVYQFVARNRNLQSCLIQDEPEEDVCFSHKMSLRERVRMLGVDCQRPSSKTNEPGADPGIFGRERRGSGQRRQPQ